MDFIQDYLVLLPRLLPPSFATPLLKLLTTAFALTRTLQTHLSPFLTKLLTQPDVASILLFLAAVFISLKVLDMLYRTVMFWINLALRLALWGGVAVLGLWVYNRGVDGFVEDMQALAEYWMGQYERYSGEIRRFQREKEGEIRVQAGQKGRGKQRGGGGWR